MTIPKFDELFNDVLELLSDKRNIKQEMLKKLFQIN